MRTNWKTAVPHLAYLVLVGVLVLPVLVFETLLGTEPHDDGSSLEVSA